MKNENLITVIITVYNKENTVARAIDSVLKQEVDFGYEILIIDDYSNDGSLQICRNYESLCPDKIKIIHNKQNLSCYLSRLIGYKNVKTKYFSFLDADDYWLTTDKMQRSIDFLENNQDFAIYMSNTYLERGNERDVYIDELSKNFDNFKEYVCGHTSAIVYRNLFPFMKKELAKLETISKSDYKYFDGETFLTHLFLTKGKAHFENKIESVYVITKKGIWTNLSSEQQEILNCLFFYKMYVFLNDVKYVELLAKSYDSILNGINKFKKISNEGLKEMLSCVMDILRLNSSLRFMETEAFYFFLPSKIVGGYEFLFMRMAKYLSNEIGIDVYYVDYVDGFVAKQLVNSKIKLIQYDDSLNEIISNSKINLITPITLAYQLPEIKAPQIKMCFWVAHPKSYEWLKFRSGLSDEKLQVFFGKLNEKKGMCFMDWCCYDGLLNKCNTSIVPLYVPVFADQKNCFCKQEIVDVNAINIAWLGRLDSDKIYSLLNLLYNFDSFPTKKKKIIHIIGDGKSKELIKTNVYESIKIVFLSTLIGEVLQNYLIDNVDILYGMGLSLLEGASLKIPSVLIPCYEKCDIGDKYINLYDLNSFNLGLYIEQVSDAFYDVFKFEKFADIIDLVYKDNGKKLLGEKCYQYFVENHTVDISIRQFLLYCIKNEFYYHDYINNRNESSYKYKLKIVVRMFFSLLPNALFKLRIIDENLKNKTIYASCKMLQKSWFLFKKIFKSCLLLKNHE